MGKRVSKKKPQAVVAAPLPESALERVAHALSDAEHGFGKLVRQMAQANPSASVGELLAIGTAAAITENLRRSAEDVNRLVAADNAERYAASAAVEEEPAPKSKRTRKPRAKKDEAPAVDPRQTSIPETKGES